MKGAGGGRPRKPAGQIRHRNPVTKETIVVPAGARVDDVPEPAIPFNGVRSAIWLQMWAQPVATLWALGDVAPLTRLVILQTTPATYAHPGLLAETRQLEDRFLLNPYARAQQRVVIVTEDGQEVDSDVAWIEDARARLRGTN